MDVEFEAGVVEFSADAVVVVTVDVVDFAPDLVSDLSVGGSGGDCDGFVVGHEPPDDGEGGGVGLAGAFGRIDRDPVVSAKGFEDLPLVVSQGHAETLGDEPFGLVSPLGAFAGCGGVGHGLVGGLVGSGALAVVRAGLGTLGVVFSTFVVGKSSLNWDLWDWGGIFWISCWLLGLLRGVVRWVDRGQRETRARSPRVFF